MPDLPTARYRDIPRFPSVRRDLSLEAPVDLPASKVVEAIEQQAARLAVDGNAAFGLGTGEAGEPPVQVVEDYRGEGIPEGARALLLRLHYRASTRSVTDREVDGLHETLVTGAVKSLTATAGVSIRRR